MNQSGKFLGAAAVILDEQGRVLLVRHSYGMLNWELPGGAAELGESVADTAVREAREETGLVVTAAQLIGIYYEPEANGHHFVYLCRVNDFDQQAQPDGIEITECGYYPPDALPRPMSDFTERRIRDALAGAVLPLPVPVMPRQWYL